LSNGFFVGAYKLDELKVWFTVDDFMMSNLKLLDDFG